MNSQVDIESPRDTTQAARKRCCHRATLREVLIFVRWLTQIILCGSAVALSINTLHIQRSRAQSIPAALCSREAELAQRSKLIPPRLIEAIALVESGKPDASGSWHPWPWTIDVNGQGQFFATKAEAIASVQNLQAGGVRSIDVGCMQVNLMYHPDAFASLDQAFDPHANVTFATRFLTSLYNETKDWPSAVGMYHSSNAEIGLPYRLRVLALVPGQPPARMSGEDGRRASLEAAWRATIFRPQDAMLMRGGRRASGGPAATALSGPFGSSPAQRGPAARGLASIDREHLHPGPHSYFGQ